ncbi:hypothetical protein [Beijerinckia sp. L45]|uniref:hypothetical protein n=1 Tax=Beijerinckia sp. L45 TaxID=1641855 RepID=UPI00131A9743|nr:hypothetical protein [Beijerinckia sp. L45]
MMNKPETRDMLAVTVIGCQAAAAPDGAALVLRTAESGEVAFGLNLQMIHALREALSKAEQFLAQQAGHA